MMMMTDDLVICLGTVSNAFSRCTKAQQFLSFIPMFLLHQPRNEDSACSSFPRSESKLYIINYYLFHDRCLKHTFYHLHSMFQQLYCSARATFYWISFLFKYRRSGILSSTTVNMPNSVNHSIPRFSSSIIISDTTPVGPAALPFLLTTYCSQRQ